MVAITKKGEIVQWTRGNEHGMMASSSLTGTRRACVYFLHVDVRVCGCSEYCASLCGLELS